MRVLVILAALTVAVPAFAQSSMQQWNTDQALFRQQMEITQLQFEQQRAQDQRWQDHQRQQWDASTRDSRCFGC